MTAIAADAGPPDLAFVSLDDLGFGEATEPEPAPEAPASPLGALAYRPALYRRNAVAWCSVRAWRADAKRADMARLKSCKAALDPVIIAAAAGEIAALLELLFGRFGGWVATTVACGHSRRHDCFGKRLGAAVAAKLGLEFVEIFEDRFVAGVSHPKEFKKLPPLIFKAKPADLKGSPKPTGVLVIDDLATSGGHMEEALGRIRELGLPAFGAVWIAGNVK